MAVAESGQTGLLATDLIPFVRRLLNGHVLNRQALNGHGLNRRSGAVGA